jgi:urease gamma subunit
LWTNELANSVSSILQSLRRPIGEILVELGYLSLDRLTQALDAFVESASSRPVQVSIIDQPAATELDPILLKEYLQLFESRFEPALSACVERLSSEPPSLDAYRSALIASHSDFVAVRAAASFLKAQHSEEIASLVAAALERAIDLGTMVDHKVVGDMVKLAHHLLDAIRALLRDFSNEHYFQQDSNLQDLYQRLRKTCAQTKDWARPLKVAV